MGGRQGWIETREVGMNTRESSGRDVLWKGRMDYLAKVVTTPDGAFYSREPDNTGLQNNSQLETQPD